MSENKQNLAVLMGDLDEEDVLAIVRQAVQGGNPNAMAIIEECRDGVRIVGERFDKGEYYISELIMSADIFKNVIALLGPFLSSSSQGKSAGKVVFGTVKDDIHNIGKDIVISLLRAEGFEVFDMGIDVPPEKFVEKVKETGAKVVGLSGLITVSFDTMKATVDALRRAGLRDKVKVMIGGGLVNEEVRAYAGADAWGNSAAGAVTLCHKLMKEA